MYSRSDVNIRSNYVTQTRGNGIYIDGVDHGEITKNKVTDIASDEISPKRAIGIMVYGKNFTVSQNEIDNVSYNGIHTAHNDNMTISNNVISNCLLLLYDGGGIYTGGENDLLIKNNIVSNIIGNAEGTPASEPSDVIGIYLDDWSSGVTVEGNIVFNCGTTGMLLHNAHDNTIVNNVFYNNHKRAVHLSEGYQQDYMHDNDFYNNILFATGAEELTWVETSAFSSSGTMGTYSNNLHFNPDYTAKSLS
jgi:parallel beta-helix repeat protein